MKRLTGRLLVANPAMKDANFDRTVVLMLEHSEEAALGLVLNRPSHVPASEILPALEGLASSPGVVHVGGPVRPEAAICLARLRHPLPGACWSILFGSIGSVNLNMPLDGLAGEAEETRLFAGYSGWTGGQVEDEIEAKGWFVVDREEGDPFRADPADLWGEVLRRQGRARLAMLAGFPDDLTLN